MTTVVTMKSTLRPAFTLFLLLTLLTGVVYPALITGIAQGLFPSKANGSLIKNGDKFVGSELIGQLFDDPRYFWGRPSATQKDDKPFPYNGESSTGSNRGPTNPDLLKEVGENVKKLRDAHPDQTGAVPVDLVTASASGLDPHITPAAAEYQVMRVAKARAKSADEIRTLVAAHTAGRTIGLLGEPRVNVLTLNLALDAK
jgi:K+-transporting ATPase ATPase C chain